MPALTRKNSLFLETVILKFNAVFNWQVCKLKLNIRKDLRLTIITIF